MEPDGLSEWLSRLGYDADPGSLHCTPETVPSSHPYAPELRSLLKPEGAIQARAVFDVEGVPTVVFVGAGDGGKLDHKTVERLRQQIWNQNLASVVIEIAGPEARAFPVQKLEAVEPLTLETATPSGPFSASEVSSPNLYRRLPDWFNVQGRVDRRLLRHLRYLVDEVFEIYAIGRTKSEANWHAELLVGQILFLAYLNDRNITGETYRAERDVGKFHDLVKDCDRDGLYRLIDSLSDDFNGDFLSEDRHAPWAALNDAGFSAVANFLRADDPITGQLSFWPYDFSIMPVEMLSGIYEDFIGEDEKAETGAYYTPRNLAVLAVDQAFSCVPNPLAETIFDGACGSGILLTTAYRRLISLKSKLIGRTIDFSERCVLLREKIFGGDINSMACRVTAFSLYLSLLEGLDPADILAVQHSSTEKLPALSDRNLLVGETGDIFGSDHRFLNRRFGIIISNPPWAEPKQADSTSADSWAEGAGIPVVRRQIAGAYALRAPAFSSENTVVCLIIPVSLILGSSSQGFVEQLLRVFQPVRLINFGDLQGLIFPTAEDSCHIFLGNVRPLPTLNAPPVTEKFEYIVPKADLSIAFARLTMTSADRHLLFTNQISESSQVLTTLMWGDKSDLTILNRLKLRGRLGDLWTGPPSKRIWKCRKGVHINDASRKQMSAAPLREIPHISIRSLTTEFPFLKDSAFVSWPADKPTVVGLDEKLLSVFEGPRILLPDGISRQMLNVRAVFVDKPASFTHSVGVIAGRPFDREILQFLTVYLRSKFGRYVLMMTGWKMLCERNAVHLADLEEFPFFFPENAPNPNRAHNIIAEVNKNFEESYSKSATEKDDYFNDKDGFFNKAVYDYFDIGLCDRDLIDETVNLLATSIRPRGYSSLDTPAQAPAGSTDLRRYCKVVEQSLETWRDKLGGTGQFQVHMVASDEKVAGPVGFARISYHVDGDVKSQGRHETNDKIARETIKTLRKNGLQRFGLHSDLELVPDTHIWVDGDFYITRPLTQRSWTLRMARRDAEHLVADIQRRQRQAYLEAAES